MIRDIVVHKMGFKLFFVESICDDPRIIEQNIMVRVPTYLLLLSKSRHDKGTMKSVKNVDYCYVR